MDRREMKKLILFHALEQFQLDRYGHKTWLADWMWEEKYSKDPNFEGSSESLVTDAVLRRFRELLQEMVENAESKLD
jgi:hypothetical protein